MLLLSSSGNSEEILLDIRFGIPLFDEKISEIIRNGIVKHKLCAKDKYEKKF
jgi:hypothetical protein